MKLNPLLSAITLAALACAGCSSTSEKEQIITPHGTLTDQSQDVSFRAFVSRLRKAAEKRDPNTLAQMMTPNFGYSWGEGGEGPGVFAYWDRHRLWPEVAAVLNQPFVLSGDYMVAPEAVATDPDYSGYRAGIRLVNGSWRFAYFVPTPTQ